MIWHNHWRRSELVEMNSAITEEQYQKFFTGLLASDRMLCTHTMQSMLVPGMELKDLYVHLFQRALYEVGEQWEKGKISVAVEHAATAIVERLLTLVQPKVFGGGERKHTAVIACVAEEYHQLGARMIADLFELQGWRCFFLGANTPLPDLLQLIRKLQPQVVGLSLSIYFNLPSLLHVYASLRKEFPNQLIIVGGQAFRWGGSDAFSGDSGVLLLPSLYDVDRFLVAYETE
jgi:MerR family transcriptional regulator, light-induced transcriptional regulator